MTYVCAAWDENEAGPINAPQDLEKQERESSSE